VWIKRNPEKIENAETESIETKDNESKSVDHQAFIDEEKKVYRGLVKSYVEKKRSFEPINRIFKKNALSKRDQARIDKIKKVQRKVRRQVRERYAKLIKEKKVEVNLLRICNLSYDLMGLPKEAKRLKEITGGELSTLWSNSIKETSFLACDLIMVSGVYSTTITNAEEFNQNTVELLGRAFQEPWSFVSTLNGRGASYILFYKISAVQLESAETLDDVSLRRGGGLFSETKFSIPPSQFAFRDKKNSDFRFKLMAFDFVDKKRSTKKIETTYKMQMASAVKELLEIRQHADPALPWILLINNRFKSSHPAYHILVNSLKMEKFLPEGGCSIVENKKDSVNDYFSCEDSIAGKDKRALYSTFSDLYTLPAKTPKSYRKKIRRNKINSQNGIFVLQEGVPYVYSKDQKRTPRAGFEKIGSNDLGASITWTDFHFK